jgi:type IV pilus biogenesis protein PilP
MNSYRCLSMLRNNKFLATVAFVTVLAGSSAIAQEIVLPAAPAAAPSPVSPPAPSTLQEMMANGKGQDAPVVKDKGLPEGASVGDAEERNKALAAEASRKLDALIGTTLGDKREKNTQAEQAARQNKLMEMQYQLDLAKVSKELWKTLNGEDSDKENKIKDLETKITDLNAQNEALKNRASALAATGASGTGSSDPDPVVASISGAGGNIEAKILVPYVGEIYAHRGDTLPNGQKVVSISQSGVTVQKNDEKKVLAFGTAVPRTRPVRNIVPAGSVVFPQ